MVPIPENARPDDPRWAIAFLHLAHGLVIAGAKAKIIERFTESPHRRVREMYKALRGIAPPAGPVMQGSARFFALPSKNTSEASRIQSAIFLACYERMGSITTTPVQRGWRLLAAFNAYLSLTENFNQSGSIKRLDINQAYALLTHCGFMTWANGPELQRKECPVCSINYPIVANERLDAQGCPVCAINANCLRLAHQAAASGRRAATSQTASLFPSIPRSERQG
jgi:Flagellar transcriptional activator (FlhC)